MEYRREIDGLRAVAVIPVILFHAGFPIFSGGFVGVDVFFVISGYLITTIILSEKEQGTFSLVNFYERRARRIMPALFFVMFASTLAAWVWLYPSHMMGFSQSLIAVPLFSSNILFWQETGYWGVENELNPLLHTWSLAVEEQYYVLFPLFLMLMWRFKKRYIFSSFVLIAFGSLLLSQYLVNVKPTANFFLLPTRGWELAIGAGIAFYSLYRTKEMSALLSHKFVDEMMGVLGIVLIAIAVFQFDESTPFPSVYALIPTLGTALIIIFSNNKTIIGKVLGSKPLVAIGLISYSAYLWHQPLFVFVRHQSLIAPSSFILGILSLVSLILAYISWKYIEAPFRKKGFFPRNQIFIYTLLCSLFFIVIGVIGIETNGLSFRFSEKELRILDSKNDRYVLKDKIEAELENGESLSVYEFGDMSTAESVFAVWGDSHGNAMLPAIIDSAKKNGLKGVYLGRVGCLPLLGAYQVISEYRTCNKHNDKIIQYFESNEDINKVFLVSRWSIYAMGERFKNEFGHVVYINDSYSKENSLQENKKVYERSFQRTIEKLNKLKKQIVIVKQVPETEYNIPEAYAKVQRFDYDVNLAPLKSDYHSRQEFVEGVFQKYNEIYPLSFIDPATYLCENDRCMIADDEDIPIYRDTNHLTRSFALNLSHMFDSELK